MIRPKFYSNTDRNERWYTCVLCGTDHRTIELQFISGNTEPSVDDVLVGASSGDGGIVSDVVLWSGTWTGGDAAGMIELTSPSGLSAQTDTSNPFTAFTLSEDINNTTTDADNVMSCHATNYGQGKQYGRFHPESNIIRYRGRDYCVWHFAYRFAREWDEEEKIDIKEDYTEWI